MHIALSDIYKISIQCIAYLSSTGLVDGEVGRSRCGMGLLFSILRSFFRKFGPIFLCSVLSTLLQVFLAKLSNRDTTFYLLSVQWSLTLLQDFLSKFPNPDTTFGDEATELKENYINHARIQLSHDFSEFKSKYIFKVFFQHKQHFMPTFQELEMTRINILGKFFDLEQSVLWSQQHFSVIFSICISTALFNHTYYFVCVYSTPWSYLALLFICKTHLRNTQHSLVLHSTPYLCTALLGHNQHCYLYVKHTLGIHSNPLSYIVLIYVQHSLVIHNTPL